MVKQYIGARYVPIFDGEYNVEKAYEPLTIVTYLNNSYTSKKTVQAGILPTNTEYWALTGNYNAQVEEYRREVEELREEVTQDVTDLREDLNNSKVYVTPEEFGAVGDGVADDTEAIQAALDSGSDVIFSKKYKITETLNVPTNTVLLGLGGEITTPGDITMISALDVSWVSIKSLKLSKECGANYHILCSGYHITIDSCYLSGRLTNVNNPISGIHKIAATTVDGFEFVVKNNQINVGQILIEGGTDGYVMDNIVWTSTQDLVPACYAIKIITESWHIKGNQIVGGSLGGMYVHGGGAAGFDIVSNFFDGSYETVTTGTLLKIVNCPQNVLISNNKFYNGYKNAITFDRSPYALVTSNVFINNNRSKTEDANDILFMNNTYGARGTVSANQFVNYITTQKPVLYNSDDGNIVLSDNNIIGEGYAAPYGYLETKGIISKHNLINGLIYEKAIGSIQTMIDSGGNTIYGIMLHTRNNISNMNIRKVTINGTDVTGQYSLIYDSTTYGVAKGDNGNLYKIINVIYSYGV